jgi:hypothetical protein
MEHSKVLQAQIQQHLPWHRARSMCFAKFIHALITRSCLNVLSGS